MFDNLKKLGLTPRFEAEANSYQDYFIARIATQHRDLYRVICETGDLMATISGKFRYETMKMSDFPAVGDFVMIDRRTDKNGHAIIHQILSRKSAFIRKAAGTSNDDQVIATNIDTVFICMSLNNDFNVRRLERYLSISWDSGAIPVIILTKADLCNDIDNKIAEVEAISLGVDILVTSSMIKDGYTTILNYIKPAQTFAFIGSSGVGKSTLINRLIGNDELETSGLRSDDKGHHTTTSRELILLENGGIVIDTPGMRELGLEGADIAKSFADIEVLASQCRFHDCSHRSEPGCAIQQALLDGELSEDRFNSYLKLQKEAQYSQLTAKQLEIKKGNEMFKEVGGIKKARKVLKQKNKKH